MKKHVLTLLSIAVLGSLISVNSVLAQPDTNILMKVEVKSINKLLVVEGIEEDPDGVYAFLELGFTNNNGFKVGIQKEKFAVILDGYEYVLPPFPPKVPLPDQILWDNGYMRKVDRDLGEGVFVRVNDDNHPVVLYSVDTSERLEIEPSTNRVEKTIRISLGKKDMELTKNRIYKILNVFGSRPVPFNLQLKGSGEFGMQLLKPESDTERGWVFTDKLTIDFTFIPLVDNSVIME